jgi:hypothetical protein
MGRRSMTEGERWTVLNALSVAAAQYRKDALADPNLKRQFEDQAQAATDLYNLIEQLDDVRLQYPD